MKKFPPSPHIILTPLHNIILKIRGATAFCGDHAGTDGVCGRAGFCEEWALVWGNFAFEHVAAFAGGGLCDGGKREVEAGHGVVVLVVGIEDESAVGKFSESAPEGVGDVEDVVHDGARFGVTEVIHGAGVGVDDGGLACFALLDHEEECLEDVHGVETCDDAWGVEAVGDEAVRIHAKDGGHVTGEEEGVDGAFWVCEERGERGRHELVEREDREILDALGLGHLDGGGDGGRGGFKANTKEHYVIIGVFGGELERIEGGIDDFDAAALGLGKFKVAALWPRDAHEVAEGGDDDVVAVGEVEIGGDFAFVGDADGATGAREVAHSGGKQGAQATLEDGNRVGSADFHEGEGPVELGMELFE